LGRLPSRAAHFPLPFSLFSQRASSHPRPKSAARATPSLSLSLFRSLTAGTRLLALLPPDRALPLSLWSLGPACQRPGSSLLPSSSPRTGRPKSPASPSAGPARRDPRPGLYLAPADPLHLISYAAATPNPSAAAPFWSAAPSLCAAVHPSLRCTPALAKACSSFAIPPGSSPRLPPSTPSPAHAGFKPEDCRRYPAPPLRFLAASDPRTSLTPVGPSQDLHESTHSDQKPGGALHHLPPRAPPIPAARPSSPTSLRRSSGSFRPSVSTTSSPRSSCARCRGPRLALVAETRAPAMRCRAYPPLSSCVPPEPPRAPA
jgi:hypothetical protein